MAEKRLTSLACKLRNDPTEAEKRLWLHLRASRFCGQKFTRQYQIGGFIVDFACRSLRLAIELDGGQHAVVLSAYHKLQLSVLVKRGLGVTQLALEIRPNGGLGIY